MARNDGLKRRQSRDCCCHFSDARNAAGGRRQVRSLLASARDPPVSGWGEKKEAGRWEAALLGWVGPLLVARAEREDGLRPS